jgi:HipA-like protein
MKSTDKLGPQSIEAIQVFLEKRKARWLVGILASGKDGKGFVFEYTDQYLYSKSSIPVGPDIPLTRKKYKSENLFKSFNDRIPSSKNPSYAEYCKVAGISPDENNQIVLLATIGRRGPSSFVFEPIYKEAETADLVTFRRNLHLTVREFATVFDFSTATLNKIKKGQGKSAEAMKRLKIFFAFPEAAIDTIKGAAVFCRKKKKPPP